MTQRCIRRSVYLLVWLTLSTAAPKLQAQTRRAHTQERDQRDAEAAADPETKKQQPEQDETDSTTFDTDQHSDAPGPTGTG
jgi:hypothetical protein